MQPVIVARRLAGQGGLVEQCFMPYAQGLAVRTRGGCRAFRVVSVSRESPSSRAPSRGG